jgi:type III restriction enzyme
MTSKPRPISRRDLKPFQERAAGTLASMLQEYPSDRFPPLYNRQTSALEPFLCRLRAITGAGKTPILALTATHLKTGIILWTTPRGAVISQTLANLKPGGKYAALLPENTNVLTLGEMSPQDWTDAMDATDGLTILLATVASFNQDGDKLRIYQKIGDVTRWQLLGGQGPGSRRRPLYVFYDEGHGATENQFFRLRELEPRAFVLASASPLPEDLSDLLSGRTPEERARSLEERTTAVPTKEVVEAGLLKNRLYFMDCNTAQADAVAEANGRWRELVDKLAPLGKVPVACFIVNETTRGVDIWQHLVALGVDKARIAVHVTGARDIIVDRTGSSQGLIDTYTGRKAEDRSPDALKAAGYTHIIWNRTLAEGWDEPLAYVAYVDDRGRSMTDIVQKIGRFVRQPDATPFDDPDLNSAYFYFNVPDEEFASLIRQTQEEMETSGYEVIGLTRSSKPADSRTVEVLRPQTIERVAPWFGEDVTARDKILLGAVPPYADEALQARGSIRQRVFDVSRGAEDETQRSEESRERNDIVTPWSYLTTRLAAIDSRLVNEHGTIFSAGVKDERKLKQPMQYGSEAMADLESKIGLVRDRLNDEFRLKSLGRHGIYTVPPFKLVSPDVAGVSDTLREKYRVRRYQNAVHEEYNGLNGFEVRVAEALDTLGLLWCRNPVNGYGIPIPELGADTIWFYPDFLLWTDKEVWAIDPKGKHILEAAVAQKLLDLSSIEGLTKPIRIAFVLEGSYVLDTQGSWSKTGREGYTLVKKTTTGPKARAFTQVQPLVEALTI